MKNASQLLCGGFYCGCSPIEDTCPSFSQLYILGLGLYNYEVRAPISKELNSVTLWFVCPHKKSHLNPSSTSSHRINSNNKIAQFSKNRFKNLQLFIFLVLFHLQKSLQRKIIFDLMVHTITLWPLKICIHHGHYPAKYPQVW